MTAIFVAMNPIEAVIATDTLTRFVDAAAEDVRSADLQGVPVANAQGYLMQKVAP